MHYVSLRLARGYFDLFSNLRLYWVILHSLEHFELEMMIGFTVPHYCNCPGGCEWARLDQIDEMLHMKSSIRCNHSKNASYTYAKGSWVAQFCMVFLPSPVDASAIETRERSFFWFVRKIRPEHLAIKPHRKTLLFRNFSPGIIWILAHSIHFTRARSVFWDVPGAIPDPCSIFFTLYRSKELNVS